jgi:hypothetical protein
MNNKRRTSLPSVKMLEFANHKPSEDLRTGDRQHWSVPLALPVLPARYTEGDSLVVGVGVGFSLEKDHHHHQQPGYLRLHILSGTTIVQANQLHLSLITAVHDDRHAVVPQRGNVRSTEHAGSNCTHHCVQLC